MTTETSPAVQDTALLQVSELQKIVATAPEILSANIQSKTKAIEAGRKLIDLAKAGMNDTYDEQLSIFVTKVKKTVDSMNERRKPFTQIVDAVKKQFTSLEAELKPIMDEAQEIRNQYATAKMKAKQEEERLAQLKLNREKELIELRQFCEVEIGNFFSRCISKTKTEIADYFNALTLETIDGAKEVLESTTTNFDSRHALPQSIQTTTPRYISLTDINVVIGEVLGADYSLQKKEFAFEIQNTLKEYIDKLPSKKAELEAIEKAGAEEKARLELQAKERQEAEQKRLADEQAAREAKAREEAAIAATAATAGAMVDATVATETPNVKEAYEVKLSNNAGYLLLIQFWFEKEGKTLPAEKLEKYTLERIKRFCEAYALKNEEFIQSPLIKYEPVYKAK